MEEIIAYLVGRPVEDEDTQKVLLGKLRVRFVRKDRDHLIVTQDLRSDRINLEVDNGIITKAYIG